MGKKLTRANWTDVGDALRLVPLKARNESWVKTAMLVDHILSSKSDIAREYDPETLKFSVDCDLCKKSVLVTDNHVTFFDGKIRHYDCNAVHIEKQI